MVLSAIFLIIVMNLSRFKMDKYNYIYLLFALSYFFLIIFFIHNDTYVFPVITLLVVLVCNLLISKTKFQLYLFYILLSMSLLSTFTQINNYNIIKKNQSEIKNLISDLDKINILKPKILADGSHIIRYYSDYKQIYNISFYNKYKPKFYVYINYEYYDLNNLIKDQFFDIIIFKKIRNFSNDDFLFLNKNDYISINNNNFYIFYKNY